MHVHILALNRMVDNFILIVLYWNNCVSIGYLLALVTAINF